MRKLSVPFHSKTSRIVTASALGSLALVLALLYTQALTASVFSGTVIAVGAYITMYFNEKGKPRIVFAVSSGSTVLAMLAFWISGLHDTYPIVAGIGVTFVAGVLWYYVTLEASVHKQGEEAKD